VTATTHCVQVPSTGFRGRVIRTPPRRKPRIKKAGLTMLTIRRAVDVPRFLSASGARGRPTGVQISGRLGSRTAAGLHTKNLEIKSKKPTAGGGQEFASSPRRGPAALSRADFFLDAGVLGIQTAIKEIKSRVISMPAGPTRSSAAPFICRARPRGRSNLWRLSIRDRRAKRTNLCAKFRENIFFGGAGNRSRKNPPRNSRGGVAGG
jgi:hypothetical protein